jgi:hypothetical protein
MSVYPADQIEVRGQVFPISVTDTGYWLADLGEQYGACVSSSAYTGSISRPQLRRR